jgi:hypothetical protein
MEMRFLMVLYRKEGQQKENLLGIVLPYLELSKGVLLAQRLYLG